MKRLWLVILGVWLCNVAFATDQPQSTGELPGLFTINSAGDKVCFSQGNLRCNTSSGSKVWSFAQHQYDILGDANISGTNLAAVIDLFGWSGNGTANFGVSNKSSNDAYKGTNFRDWGLNPITNGGDAALEWRTLSKDEWTYLIDNHSKKKISVNNVNGWVILPDNCSLTLTDIADSYTAQTWNAIEKKGVVFLPCTGYRTPSPSNTITYSDECYYWTSAQNGSNNAYVGKFISPATESIARNLGCAVRLVKDKTDCTAKIIAVPNISGAGTITITAE